MSDALGVRSVLRLGTRKSLLAVAQSTWVAREVERLNKGLTVELVGIETRGDRIIDIPLRQAEGKDFFVEELNEALASGRVDFCVHSMKDLSLERPKAFVTAAIPPRADPRDIFIFNSARTQERLARGEALRIGTSSPRRLQLIPPFLKRALPRFKNSAGDPQIEMIEIRGNVNTRLGRLYESEDSARCLDGVVLALAGLTRLWRDDQARPVLAELLAPARFMVMPLTHVPGAPAQGALAVECRANDQGVLTALAKLHCEKTFAQVQQERAVLARWGGGCHQRFGAAAIELARLGTVMWARGVGSAGEVIDEVSWNGRQSGRMNTDRNERGINADECFSSSEWRSVKEVYLQEINLNEAAQHDLQAGAESIGAQSTSAQSMSAWMCGHARALPPQLEAVAATKRIWAAGVSSWFALAQRGIWVEGSTEGLGAEACATWQEPVLRLPPPQSWIYLTHSSAASIHAAATAASSAATSSRSGSVPLKSGGSTVKPIMKTVATYRLEPREVPPEILRRLKSARYLYWSSYSAYEVLVRCLDETQGLHHSCGPGKTAENFESRGIPVTVFPSEKEWSRWTNGA